MEDELRDLQEQINTLDERIEDMKEELEKERHQDKDYFFQQLSNIKKRVSEIENEIGVEEHDSEVLYSGSSKMARVSVMEESERKKELNISLFRASIVWENFDSWSKYTQHGRVIKSGELRDFLSTYLKEDFSWSQIYRVMDAFEENTSDIFWQEDTDDVRILVRKVG